MKWLFSFLLVLLFAQADAQTSYYKFNNNCQQAYQKLLFLQFDSAKIFIDKEKQENPNNLIPILLNNYRDFLRLVITEDQALFEEIKDRKSARMDAWEEGPESSPWYLSGQAQIKLQWAFARVLFDEYFTAATEINSAYHILEENKVLFPNFLADNMGIGILHAMIGVVPEKYQWAMEMFGLYGSIDQGMEEMQKQIKQDGDHPFAKETLFYYTFIRLNLQTDSSRFTELLQYYQSNTYKNCADNSPLLHFSKATILLKMDNDLAIEHLKNAPHKTDAYHFYYTDFLLGQALLFKLDANAGEFYKKYIDGYTGKNYKKAAWQKWGWQAFVNKDTTAYLKAMQEIRNVGTAILDADKVAEKESEMVEENWLPNLYLLRSRLQFDGHYYEGALRELSLLKLNESDEETRLEYHYRKARIYHEMQQIQQAKKEYTLAISRGRESDRYFAAKSALKMGEIFELEQNYKTSANFYSEVLDLDFNEYRKGIRAKAKAGLQRVSKLVK